MLPRARARLPVPGRDIELVQADAVQFLAEHAGAFDAAVLHLVLSVVPDGARACTRRWRRFGAARGDNRLKGSLGWAARYSAGQNTAARFGLLP